MSARPFFGATALTSLCFLYPVSLRAACDCSPIAVSGLNFSCFSITVSGTSAQRTEVSEGISAWQSGCNSESLIIPRMEMADPTNNPNPCSSYPPDQVLNVQISFVGTQPSGNPPECGFADINFSTGNGTIEIYNQSNDGGTCSQRQEDIVSHEIGHHLGFGDISGECQLACAGRMMSGDIYQSGTVVDRSVSTEDCSRADQMNSPRPPRTIRPGGGPDPCFSAISAESTFLNIAGSEAIEIQIGQTPLFTRRLEEVDGFTYIMEDWAVVSFEQNPSGRLSTVRVERSSSPFYMPDREKAALNPDIAGVGLLIEAPTHLHNSRHIPMPEVRLRPIAVPYIGRQVTAALRIDIGEDRQIRDIQILHTVGTLPLGFDLIERIRSNLKILYASSQQHRVIVFLVVNLDEGRIHLRQSKTVLPRCCCNPICI